MPYVSQAQSRFMHARHPEIAKRWDAEHEQNIKSLPQHVKGGKAHKKEFYKPDRKR